MDEHTTETGSFRGIKYKKRWLRFGGSFAVVGLVILIVTQPRPDTAMSRTVAGMLGIGILSVIYSFSPAMGQLMSGDKSWSDLSTKEQIIQLLKWSVIGAIVWLIGLILFTLISTMMV